MEMCEALVADVGRGVGALPYAYDEDTFDTAYCTPPFSIPQPPSSKLLATESYWLLRALFAFEFPRLADWVWIGQVLTHAVSGRTCSPHCKRFGGSSSQLGYSTLLSRYDACGKNRPFETMHD